MKRFLTLILTLMLVLAMGTGMVMADKYVEDFVTSYTQDGETADEIANILSEGYGLTLDTEAMQITDASTGEVVTEEEFYEMLSSGGSSSSSTSEGYDEESIVPYVEYDISDINNIVVTTYVTGTDETLAYLAPNYTDSEMTTYDGKAALKLSPSTISKEDMSNSGLSVIEKEGFFADKRYYVYPALDLVKMGYTEGKLVEVYVMKFKGSVLSAVNAECDGNTVTKKLISGDSGATLITQTQINWINLLIVIMGVVVIILILVTVIVTKNKKKTDEGLDGIKEEEFESVGEVFDQSEEAEIENPENVEDVENAEISQVEEPVAEDAAEEMVEEITITDISEDEEINPEENN